MGLHADGVEAGVGAAAAGESALRINLVGAWRETTVYTEAERAALALDTASAFTGRSLVTVPYDGRVLVLISRMSEESLRAIAARIR